MHLQANRTNLHRMGSLSGIDTRWCPLDGARCTATRHVMRARAAHRQRRIPGHLRTPFYLKEHMGPI